MNGIRIIFGTNIRKLRKQMGLTQEKFAEIIGIQVRNLTDIENGKYMPTPQNIDKICQNLNIPVGFLFKTPEELIDEDKIQKIDKIKEKLYILDNEKINIVYNIVNHAF